ncbi:uncharacterized protein K452DRAFT_237030 [Aplosporella prunicola CBS 121167]|uniref:Defect at low temperature protein 1 n=1 Tax=Aplosporella prunicola CBS 121167 TaxID=1176127 RepID=A0A6A6B0I2_9PEZI|nr:uncharacterized protein K452DRAFT_237030 [Aplosporella prunicola CBS 121167]KAF2136724.1 hypothetical protein K452DRAFT_237030 [Aplosporella prunicola CBS 121167]
MRKLRIPFFRIWYSTTYTVIFLILVVLLAVSPADLISQTIRNRSYPNAFVVGGVYVLTLVIILFIFASRLYTNRTVLAGIPKAYIPVEKGEVGKTVRRMIVKGFERSALIAWDSRPRDVRTELDDGDVSTTPSVERHHHHPPFKRKHRSRDMNVIPIDPEKPPWGHISHPGWSSPSANNLPTLQYDTVVAELPNLIEAKAVSLAPSHPAFAFPMPDNGAPLMPDARIVALLQRPATMGLRDYIGHLSSFGLINPPELGTAFLDRYEYARFSMLPLSEDQFRDLMEIFAEILTGMTGLNPDLVVQLQAEEYGSDTSSLAPSHRTSHSNASTIHYKTPQPRPQTGSTYTQSTTSTPVRRDSISSRSIGTVRTARTRFFDAYSEHRTLSRTSSGISRPSTQGSVRPPRTPASLAPSSTSSLRSARSVIRLTPNPRPGEVPYQFDLGGG